MILANVTRNNGTKRWILKRKFALAGSAWLVGSYFAYRGVSLATTAEQISLMLSSYSNFCAWLLGLVFGADVADKKLNGGQYHSHVEDELEEER